MTKQVQPSASSTAAAHEDDFFLPDFCNMTAVLRLLIVSELLAIFLTLADIQHLRPFPWADLGLKSFLLTWVAMSTAALLCSFRTRLEKMSRVTSAFLIFFLFVALVAFFTFLAEGVLLFLHIHQAGQINVAALLVRNVMMGGIIAGLVLRYFYLQEQLRLRQRAELTARVQALQARIRPHFLFNSMNIIASLIAVDPDRAEEVVEDLSALFRASLKAEGEVPLQKEIDLCQRYLNIEQVRLGKRLNVEWRIEDMPTEILIPALTLQPLLENAIYHGVEPASAPSTVTIFITWGNGVVTIVITNPYHPQKGSHHKGNQMAMGNIRERLRAHYGEQAKLQTQASEEFFTTYLSYPFVLMR